MGPYLHLSRTDACKAQTRINSEEIESRTHMPPLRRGPRPPVDESPLPFVRAGDDVADFERFCAEYIRLEKNVAMVIRPWQRDIVSMVWGEHRPKMAALAIGRGNSKSSLAAALCLFRLFLDDDILIDLLAYDERQAGEIGRICSKMITRHPELEKRAKLFRDHITVGMSELCWLPATPAALEGRTPDFTCCDEGGVISRDVFETAAFSASKKPHAQLFLIGTPGDKPGSVLEQFATTASPIPTMNHSGTWSSAPTSGAATLWTVTTTAVVSGRGV